MSMGCGIANRLYTLFGPNSVQSTLVSSAFSAAIENATLSPAHISQLLWAAQGITAEDYLRTAPSAGALYPLELYLAAGNVDGISPGLYHYRPQQPELVLVKPGDLRHRLAQAALGQDCIADSAAFILFTAAYAGTSGKYGRRAAGYIHIETGHAAQNVCLQATALGLGTVTVGAFEDEEVKRVAALPESYEPVYLMPVGRT